MQTQQLKKEFANGLHRILTLTRASLEAESASFFWVNRAKEQFVLASESHDSGSIGCLQRTPFREHYLEPFVDLEHPLVLHQPQDIATFRNSNFFLSDGVSAPGFKQLILFPIQNYQQTVAIVLMALQKPVEISTVRLQKTLTAFYDLYSFYFSLSGTLNELRAEQEQWVQYDQELDELLDLSVSKKSPAQLLEATIKKLYSILSATESESSQQASSLKQNSSKQADLVFATPCAGEWVIVYEQPFSSSFSDSESSVGLRIEPHTLGMNALESGKPEFLVHVNPSPYRISSQESPASGASLAIPILHDGRREGLFIFTHPNPRFFSGSVQHKLSNLVRQHSIQLTMSKDEAQEFFFHDHSTFLTTEIWKMSLERLLEGVMIRSQINKETESIPEKTPKGVSSHLIFATPQQLPTLRARYRLEELRMLQEAIASILSPQKINLKGWIGRYSEYVFVTLIVGGEDHLVERYKAAVTSSLKAGIKLSETQSIPMQLHMVSISDFQHLSLPQVLRTLNADLTTEITKQER